MLRASSLGPILSLTYRLCLEQCQRPHQAVFTLHRRQNRLSYMSTVSHMSHNSEDGGVLGIPFGVHASSGTVKTDTVSQNTKAHGRDASENKKTKQTATEDSKINLIQVMLERERKIQKTLKNEKDLYVRQALPYTTGKYQSSIQPLYGGKFKRGTSYEKLPSSDTTTKILDYKGGGDQRVLAKDASHQPMSEEDVYYHLCHVIATTTNVEDAWSAYSTLLTMPSPKNQPYGTPPIPFAHLHRLCRLLSQNRPRTRIQFLRLLSILYTIRKHGGMLQTFEWNALISNAGTGWRGSKAKDFHLALHIFDDMVSGEPPGSSFSMSDYPPLDIPPLPLKPDIYTYNILLSIASETLYGRAIGRATAMLRASGLSPDRITHLSLLVYFTYTNQLPGVRSTLVKMRQQGLELGLDGINACIWAYGRNCRLEWAEDIYRVLRHNILPEDEEIIDPIRKNLQDECIDISPTMMPNVITYGTMIQLMAWNGNLTRTYTVLMEMLSSLNMEPGAPLVRDEDGEIQYTTYGALYISFRSLFLGFARHGIHHTRRSRSEHVPPDKKWTISNLQAIFDTYIGLTDPIPPSWNMIYWIMVAFDRTSDHDVALMRTAWTRLEGQFKGPWGGPGHRLRVLREMLFSSDAEAYLRRYGFRTAPRKSRTYLQRQIS
ncbi:hypothetical protein EV361DRAFT_473534 [Lentinula raphanica]|nr:hypothetical protein EV361DRAFT_473534 [Lentinula raphanica]